MGRIIGEHFITRNSYICGRACGIIGFKSLLDFYIKLALEIKARVLWQTLQIEDMGV